MIKKEIEKKFFAGDFQRVLPADECEPNAKFHEKFLDVIEQAQLEVAFPGIGIHREKVEDVRVLQCLMCKIGLRGRQSGREVSDRLSLATMQLRFDLMHKHSPRPAVL